MQVTELIEDKTNYYIISEILIGGPVINHLKFIRTFKEAETNIIIRQVMEGLKYLHYRNKYYLSVSLWYLL